MRRWRYALDPVCLLAIAAYAINRWAIPLRWKNGFFRGHFADLLLIPAALPFMLWAFRRLGLRADDRPPRWREIAFLLVVWSVTAEAVAPQVFARSTGDLWDVAAYTGGALAAGLVWCGI